MPFQHEVCVRIFASLLPCFPRFLIHHLVKCSGVLAVFIKQGSHDWWVFKHVTTLLALVMFGLYTANEVFVVMLSLPHPSSHFGMNSIVSLGSNGVRSI